MGKRILILLTRQLSPALRTALVAMAAALGVLTLNLLAWSLTANWSTLWSLLLAVPLFLASVIAVGAVTAIVALKGEAREGVELERLETNVQCFESELEERQRAARAHAAIARLMGTAVRHLSAGEYSSRITLALPEPYAAFKDQFNAIAAQLEAQQIALEAKQGVSDEIGERAREIGEAAAQLKRRAEKLAERLDTDLEAIEAGAAHHPLEAIKLAQFTMGGVKIATARNIEAAAHLAELGRIVSEHAQDLTLPVLAAPETIEGDADVNDMDEAFDAAYPASDGTSALKMLQN
jgi:methyl-accepting chemotaxis protein